MKYASNPPGISIYTKIALCKKSTNQLLKWQSNCPESFLEKFHEVLAHYSNTGIQPELVDALTMASISKHNIICHWKANINVRHNQEQDIGMPQHFENILPF